MKFDHGGSTRALTYSTIFLGLSLAVVAGACGRATGRESSPTSDTEPVPGIYSAWEWVQTTGGSLGDTVTPGSSRRRYRLELLAGKRFRQISSADTVSHGTYTIGRGSTFNEKDTVVPILRFDQPLFDGYFGPVDEYAVFIHGDTLDLKDISSHPWEHRYLRVSDNPAETLSP